MKKYRKEVYMSAEAANERRRAHAGTELVCTGCGESYPAETFAHDNGSATGYQRYCPTCRQAIQIKAAFIKFITKE